MSTPSTTVLDALLEVTVMLAKDMGEELGRDGLTSTRAHLLWVLDARGPSMQQTLARDLEVSARNITALVDALVASGHVSREPHPTDRRAFLVTPTMTGAQVARQMVAGRVAFADQLFGDATEADRATTLRGLEGIRDRLASLIASSGGTGSDVP